MKKRKQSKALATKQIKNPVAKFAFQFNKAQVFKDKTKYQRKAKHQGKEPFPIVLLTLLEKVSFFVYVESWCNSNFGLIGRYFVERTSVRPTIFIKSKLAKC